MSFSLLSKACISELDLKNKNISLYDKTSSDNISDPSSCSPCKLFGPKHCDELHMLEDVNKEDSQSIIGKSFYGIELGDQVEKTEGLAAFLKKNKILSSHCHDSDSLSAAFSNFSNFLSKKIDAVNSSKLSEVSRKTKFMDTLQMSKEIIMVGNSEDMSKKPYCTDIIEKSFTMAKINSNLLPVHEVIEGNEILSPHSDKLKNVTHCNNLHLFSTSEDIEDSDDEITYILLPSDDSDFDDSTEVMRESFKSMSFCEMEISNPVEENVKEDSFKNSFHFSKDEIEKNIKSSTPMKGRIILNSIYKKLSNGNSNRGISINSETPIDRSPLVVDASSTNFSMNENWPLCSGIKFPIVNSSKIGTEDIILPDNQNEDQCRKGIIINNDKNISSLLLKPNSSYYESTPPNTVHSQLDKDKQLNCISKEVDFSASSTLTHFIDIPLSNTANHFEDNLDLPINDKVTKQSQSNSILQHGKHPLSTPLNLNIDRNQANSSNNNIELRIKDNAFLMNNSLNELHDTDLNVSFNSLSFNENLVNYKANEKRCDQSLNLESENIRVDTSLNNSYQNIKTTDAVHLEHMGIGNNILKQSPSINSSSINDLPLSKEIKSQIIDVITVYDSDVDIISISDSYCSLFCENEDPPTSEALNENKSISDNALFNADNGSEQLCDSQSPPLLNVTCHNNILKKSPSINASSINDLPLLNEIKSQIDEGITIYDNDKDVISISDSYCSLFCEKEDPPTSEALNENKSISDNALLHADNGSEQLCDSQSPPLLKITCHKNILKQSPSANAFSIDALPLLNESKSQIGDGMTIYNSDKDVISMSESYSSLFCEIKDPPTSDASKENKSLSDNALHNADTGSEQLCDKHSPSLLNVTCHMEKTCDAKEISTSIIKKDSAIEEKEDKIKSYQKPFKSKNEKENHDNNDPEWEFLKKLRSDKERYYVVRRQWKNLVVPDPNLNLTQYSFRWKRNLKKNSEISGSEVTSKRKRNQNEDSKLLPISKRRKFNNINFNSTAISRTFDMLHENFVSKQEDPQLNEYGRRQVIERYYEYEQQFIFAKEEAEAMFNFYQGLPNQTIFEQAKIEKEQTEIDYLYHLFLKHYNWSGSVFNPVIRRGRISRPRYPR